MFAVRAFLISLFFSAGLLAGAPPLVSACTCTGDVDFQRARDQSVAIFIGTLVGIRQAESEYRGMIWARLYVSAWWKGNVPDTVEILTGENEAICGYDFRPGVEHLVYALTHGASTQPVWWTHLCWRTHQVYPGDPDIAALGPPHTTGTHGMTWGRLKRHYSSKF